MSVIWYVVVDVDVLKQSGGFLFYRHSPSSCDKPACDNDPNICPNEVLNMISTLTSPQL